MIPLVGCRVKMTGGPYDGKEGTIAGVSDYRTKLTSLSEDEARLFVRGARSRFGNNWADTWFEALVDLDSGASLSKVSGKDIIILSTERVRSGAYKTV